MNPFEKQSVRGTGVKLPRLGLGGVGLAGFFEDISEGAGQEILRRSYALGIRYVDTSPYYGAGKSERRIGQYLQSENPQDLIISTKVGRVLEPGGESEFMRMFVDPDPFRPVFDYSYDGIFRSIENSLKLLGRDSVDILLLHDPDSNPDMPRQEAWKALTTLKEQGVTKAIGSGTNHCGVAQQLFDEADLDVLLLAGHYTLMLQDAQTEVFPLCISRGTHVILGGVYLSGFLGNIDVEEFSRKVWKMPEKMMQHIKELHALAARFQVDLRAAACQFSAAHPAVGTVLLGANSAQQVEENVQLAQAAIPEAFWAAMQEAGYLKEDLPLPTA